MWIPFLLSLLLVNQPINSENDIVIRQEGKPIAIEKKSNFLLPMPGGPFLNVDYFQPFVIKLEKNIYKKPQNAYIDDNGKIHPEIIGHKLNRESFIIELFSHLNQQEPIDIEIEKNPIYPEVDSEILSTIKERKIGQYLTYFNARNEKRSYNINLAAQAINNHVVFPGQTFSFNKVVGKRTAHKGYLPAPIIVKGELSEGIGGGICQVSSTLFNAVDNSGLKIVERYSHSKNVPYVPHGRDATVSWYGPDFRFRNTYNQPILIRAKTYEGKIIIAIYSSDQINYKQRKVPSATSELPDEIKVTTEME